MKKILMILCVCVLCVMIPVMALAVTQTEWNQQCKLKISADVTYYLVDLAATESDLPDTGVLPMKRGGTLTAGTYVKIVDYDSQLDMWAVDFFGGSGVTEVFIRDYRIVTATASVTIYDGKTYETLAVPEALLSDSKALFKYLADEMSGYTFSWMADGKTIRKEKGSSSNGEERAAWKSLQQLAEEEAAALNLNIEDLQQALIYAPRTGKASLRQRAAGNGKIIEKLLDGTVVYIVEEGSKYTQVLAGNKTGYIINSALEMVEPELMPIGEGVLTYNGKTTGRTAINMRCDPGTKFRKIDAWPTGTEVVIWSISEDEKWYEVEHDGVRLHTQVEYVTVTELYDYDSEEDETASEEGVVSEETDDEAAFYGDDGYDDYDDYEDYEDYEEYDDGEED